MNYYEVKIYTSTEGLEAVAAVLVMLGHETFITEDKTIVDELLAKENSYDWDYVDDSVIAQRDNETNITVYMDPDDEDTVPAIEAIKESIAMLKELDVNGVFGRLDVDDILVCDDDWCFAICFYHKFEHVEQFAGVAATVGKQSVALFYLHFSFEQYFIGGDGVVEER